MNASDLPLGSTVVSDKPKGHKLLLNCHVQQSLFDILIGREIIYERCHAEVTVEEGSEIIRPLKVSPPEKKVSYSNELSAFIEKYSKYMVHTEVPSNSYPDELSDDLRTNGYTVGVIKTMDGKVCSNAEAPVMSSVSNPFVYKPNTSYKSKLNKDINKRCEEGLHFHPTFEGILLNNSHKVIYSWYDRIFKNNSAMYIH
jgi:hypothetical protein